ncbi:MAG: NADH-quinone oxidoreductase subunit L [Bacteroidota bacterium]|nr:NADH-quinone oxidoreductase subunit L [Bacteroidota bacterium]
MSDLLWLIPALPLTGALVLILTKGNLPRAIAGLVGSGSVGLAAIVTILVAADFMSGNREPVHQTLWTWMSVGGFTPGFALYLDSLTVVFIFVITFVGFFIHIYSMGYMADDAGFARFFAYLNLFVGAMLILVMADNLVLLYLGWEGVGLCSYLLIGFWYEEEKNGYAARKAFIITRFGDTALAIGLFMLFNNLGTLNIQDILVAAPQNWEVGSQTAVAIGFLLLGGAVGKSAQLPLQTWLPDAMAGPSPVSALIHAATMVTAGVYLIARMHVIFELAPTAQLWVGILGAITLLIAGFSALTQSDLKRVLAYSTISQIGYMFLALGIGAWSSAIFHFMIHAFFKALLFLGAGAVIYVLHHEQDMFKMGGLKNKVPVIYWTFLIGSASLAAVPFITAGFFSKDQILWLAWAGEKGNIWFYLAALIGALVTAIYTFRMVFLTFFGEEKTHLGHHAGSLMTIPLIVLAVLSVVGGFIELPHNMGHVTLFSDFLSPVLPPVEVRPGVESYEWLMQGIAIILCLAGIYVAYFFYMKREDLRAEIKGATYELNRFWFSGWGFDALYDIIIVTPYVYLSRINKKDFFDKIYSGLVTGAEWFNTIFGRTQSGIMRWYIMGIVIGAVLILSLGLLLH